MFLNVQLYSWSNAITMTPHEHWGVLKYQQLDRSLDSLVRLTTDKSFEVLITTPLWGKSSASCGSLSHRVGNAESMNKKCRKHFHVMISPWKKNTFQNRQESLTRINGLTLHYNDVINGCHSISNHQPHDCFLKRLFRHRSRKHHRFASLAFVWGIHRRPVNSPHKLPVTRKMFPFDDVIMYLVRTLICLSYFYIPCDSASTNLEMYFFQGSALSPVCKTWS